MKFDSSTSSLSIQLVLGVGVRMLGILLAYGTMVFLTRNLGAHGYGQYSTALAIASVLGIFVTAGTDRLATRTLSGLQSEDTARPQREIVLVHGVAIVGCLVGLVLLTSATMFVWLRFPSATLGSILPLVIVLFPVFIFSNLRQWVALPVDGAAKTLLPEQILQPVILLGTVAGVARLTGELGIHTAIPGFAMGGLIAWFVGMKLSPVGRYLREGLRQPLSFTDLLHRMRDGLPFLSASLATVTMNRTVPLIVCIMCGYQATGELVPAMQLAALAALPLTIVNLVTMPVCARLHQRHAFDELQLMARRSCTLCVLGTIPLAAMLFFGREEIAAFLGRDFSTAGQLLSILLIGPCINACCGPNGTIMQMTGLERLYSSTLLMTNTAQIVSVLLAGITGNLVAVAVSIVVIEIARNILLSVLLWQRSGLLLLPSIASLTRTSRRSTDRPDNGAVIYSISDAARPELDTLDEVDKPAA